MVPNASISSFHLQHCKVIWKHSVFVNTNSYCHLCKKDDTWHECVVYLNTTHCNFGGPYCFNSRPPPQFISTHPSLDPHRTPPLLSVLCNVLASRACFAKLTSKYSISISLISSIKHCNQKNCAKLSEIKCIPLSYISFELSLRESLKGGLVLRKPWRNMEIKKTHYI